MGQAASSSAPLQHITQTGRTGYIRPLLHLSSHLCTGRSCRQLEMPGKPLPHLWAADAPAGHAVVGGGHPPPESPSDLRHSLSPETCPECSSGCPELWVLWAPGGLAHGSLSQLQGLLHPHLLLCSSFQASSLHFPVCHVHAHALFAQTGLRMRAWRCPEWGRKPFWVVLQRNNW